MSSLSVILDQVTRSQYLKTTCSNHISKGLYSFWAFSDPASRLFPVTEKGKLWNFFNWQLNPQTRSDLCYLSSQLIGKNQSYGLTYLWNSRKYIYITCLKCGKLIISISSVYNYYNIYAVICTNIKRQNEIGN